jgi:SAM-dependent methyltransferase
MHPLKRAVLALYNPTVNFYRNRILEFGHQRHFRQRTREKWALIESELPATPGSLLDVGCAEGYFARRAAARGWCAFGVDPQVGAIRFARDQARREGLGSAYFATGAVSPRGSTLLPSFDVILFLSAYHQISKRYGEGSARACLDGLLGACSKKMIFEPASINRKYAEPVLERENDEECVATWVRGIISRDWRIRCLGACSYSSEEPRRFLFVLERATVGPDLAVGSRSSRDGSPPHQGRA